MLGYWDNAEATRAAIDAARWMHTGDLAIITQRIYPPASLRISRP
jgi:fatty-acyl-CoA synthase